MTIILHYLSTQNSHIFVQTKKVSLGSLTIFARFLNSNRIGESIFRCLITPLLYEFRVSSVWLKVVFKERRKFQIQCHQFFNKKNGKTSSILSTSVCCGALNALSHYCHHYYLVLELVIVLFSKYEELEISEQHAREFDCRRISISGEPDPQIFNSK